MRIKIKKRENILYKDIACGSVFSWGKTKLEDEPIYIKGKNSYTDLRMGYVFFVDNDDEIEECVVNTYPNAYVELLG